MKSTLERLAAGRSLARDEARAAMRTIMAGEATPAQIAAFLAFLRARGETVEEAVGCVLALREAGVRVDLDGREACDTCGTGGDGAGTFNVSTATAFVVAAAGLPVAKHGNRSVSSRCGSADVLAALGAPIELDPPQALAALDATGFAFLLAPRYHPAIRHAMGVRKELGIRTVFNLIGPLANPASPPVQLVGLYDGSRLADTARVLLAVGVRRGAVVHGPGGEDELLPTGRGRAVFFGPEGVEERSIGPEDAGLRPCRREELRGGDPAENADLLRRTIAGEEGPRLDAILLNAATLLAAAGKARTVREGAESAREAVRSGKAADVLQKYIDCAAQNPNPKAQFPNKSQ